MMTFTFWDVNMLLKTIIILNEREVESTSLNFISLILTLYETHHLSVLISLVPYAFLTFMCSLEEESCFVFVGRRCISISACEWMCIK